ncbi:hypothetical protein BRM9_1172 [Methanobacterium formicicum]|uniref:DNA polymerase sliding clamp n=1 Tax=Methanobacterium formicicum TaxID=2162 RepID=A0A089ZHS5_METFO|nr:hypothetical protein [Methanobacterium formicicum]AIS31988.1 hypothetical protein BRM9_1172 [Methanobacterium formicicum]
MEFEKIYYFKKILSLLKQISRENTFIYSDDILKGVHFATLNTERTIILDVFLSPEEKTEKITSSKKERPKIQKFSFKTGKLFYDIIDTLEKGSIVELDFESKDLNINISYDDIRLESNLNATLDNFIGFPPSNKNTEFILYGEKMAHALNLLSKFRNDLEVTLEDDNLTINSISKLGNTKLTLPGNKSRKKSKNELKKSVYDYEIIKPLLSASKLSEKVKVIFQYNDNIKDNVLIVETSLKDYDGKTKYLFTPKGVSDGTSKFFE